METHKNSPEIICYISYCRMSDCLYDTFFAPGNIFSERIVKAM